MIVTDKVSFTAIWNGIISGIIELAFFACSKLKQMASRAIKNGLVHAKIWHEVDAKDKTLGKLAQRIGIALRYFSS